MEPIEIDNPFAEEIADSRKLSREVPPSKHRAGRQSKMSTGDKRRNKKLLRERMRNAADTAALLKALND